MRMKDRFLRFRGSWCTSLPGWDLFDYPDDPSVQRNDIVRGKTGVELPPIFESDEAALQHIWGCTTCKGVLLCKLLPKQFKGLDYDQL